MICSQNNIGEMRTFSQFPSPAGLLRRNLKLPEAVAMRLTTQEKPRIAGSLSEASFGSLKLQRVHAYSKLLVSSGMKSSDSVLPAYVAISADQLESLVPFLGTSFLGPSELSHEITATSPTCFASSADESESFLIDPDLKKLRYPGIPGDMFHLSKGDTVPVDGLFVSGYSVLIDASSLIGESKPIAVTPENPVLVAGTKVLDGQCMIMVTRVGMTIQHESLMGYIHVLRNRLGQNTIDYKALVCFVAACGTMVINSNSLFVTVPLDEASVKHLQVTSSDFAGEGLGTWCLGYMELDKEFSAEDPIPTSGYTCIGIVGSTIPPGIKESVAICRSAGINGGATERTNWVLCPC